jgi:hypothetical protein
MTIDPERLRLRSEVAFERRTIHELTRFERADVISLLATIFADGKNYTDTVNNNPELSRCVLAKHKGKLIGYVAMFDRHIIHKESQYLIGGAGDMVIDSGYRHLQLGLEMMGQVSESLVKEKYDVGMGFCKPSLLNFYEQANWLKKPEGGIYAIKSNQQVNLGITILYPSNPNLGNDSFWFHDDIMIGNGSW